MFKHGATLKNSYEARHLVLVGNKWWANPYI